MRSFFLAMTASVSIRRSYEIANWRHGLYCSSVYNQHPKTREGVFGGADYVCGEEKVVGMFMTKPGRYLHLSWRPKGLKFSLVRVIGNAGLFRLNDQFMQRPLPAPAVNRARAIKRRNTRYT